MTAYVLLRAQSYWTDCIAVYATLEAAQNSVGGAWEIRARNGREYWRQDGFRFAEWRIEEHEVEG